MKLRNKLIITFVLIAVIPIIVMGILGFNTDRRVIIEEIENHLISTNILKSDELDRWVKDNENSLEELAQRPLIRDYTAILTSEESDSPSYSQAQEDLLNNHLSPRLRYGGFHEIFIVNPFYGEVMISTDSQSNGENRAYQEYFTEGRENTYVQGVYYSVNTGRPSMTIGTPIKDNNSELVGVMVGRLDLDELTRIMEQQSGLNQTEDTYLVNSANFFVTEPRFGDSYALRKTIQTKGVEAGLAGEDGVAFYDDYRGVPVIGAYKWLPEYDMCLITEIDQSEAFTYIENLGKIMAGIVCGIVILILITAYFIARAIVRPVKKLARGTEIIGAGNLGYKVGIKSKDEIGDLSRAFDKMTGKLKLTTVSRDELAKSEERYHSTLDNMLEGCQIIGYDWRYLYLNDVGLQHSRMNSEQLLGHTMMEVYPGIDKTEVFQWLKKCMEKRVSHRMINQFVYPDGSKGWFELSIQPMTEGISVLSWDITEQKQSADALQAEQSKFERIVDTAPGAICIFRQETDRSAYYPYASPAIKDIYGLTPDELLQDAAAMWVNIHPDDIGRLSEEIDMSARNLSPWYSEFRYQHPDKGEVWIEVRFTPVRDADRGTIWYGIVLDITERKQAERELQELSNRQQALLATIPEIVIQTDVNKIYTWTNKAGIEFFGDDVIGKEADYYFVGEQDTYDIVQPLFEGDENLIYVESWQRRQDGQKRLLAWWCRTLKDEAGNVTGALSTARDITEMKQAEDEIRKLNTELEQRVEERTSQLQATNKELGAFAYSVSHDLRAPLRAIDGYTRILQEDYEPFLDQEGKRICSVIRDNAHNMASLIDDLLSFSRLGRAEIEVSNIDMANMARAIFFEVTDPEERDKIDLQINSLPPVQGDPSLMRQVWINLLSNAVKFTSKLKKPVIQVLGKRQRNEIIYTVKDNGAGFDMEYANKLFGVFQRLHSTSEFEGNGVGLAIVQRVIHRHKGRVWAEGAVNKGAKFSFALPDKGDKK
jgi:PAS domain S-box-containing protein